MIARSFPWAKKISQNGWKHVHISHEKFLSRFYKCHHVMSPATVSIWHSRSWSLTSSGRLQNESITHCYQLLYIVIINDHCHYHCNAFCLSHLRNAPSWMLLMGLLDKSRSLLHFCISFFVFLFFCIFFVRHIQIPVQQGENGQWWWLWMAVILVIESRLLLDDENLGGGLNNGFGDLDNNLSWGMWEKEYPGINLRLLWLKT